MERLTYREDYGWVGVQGQSDGFASVGSQVVLRLAEFEDFMEEQGLESLDELTLNIEYLECLKEELEWSKFNYNVLFKSRGKLYKENQALKARWEKLKDFIDTFKEHNIDEANLAWNILDKMRELELADLIRKKGE